jgi:hypothetical protein
MTENFIERYYSIEEFNGIIRHDYNNSAPVMNREGWKAVQMLWQSGSFYVLWERKEHAND